MHFTIGNTVFSIRKKAEIESQPQLKDVARWLMPVPRGRMYSDIKFACTFGLRRNYVLVYDEDGDAWIGPATNEVVYHLARFGYKNKKHLVPLRGEGEKFAGDPIVVDGFTITVYPDWIGRKSPWEDLAFWAFLEKSGKRCYTNKSSIEDDFRSRGYLAYP